MPAAIFRLVLRSFNLINLGYPSSNPQQHFALPSPLRTSDLKLFMIYSNTGKDAWQTLPWHRVTSTSAIHAPSLELLCTAHSHNVCNVTRTVLVLTLYPSRALHYNCSPPPPLPPLPPPFLSADSSKWKWYSHHLSSSNCNRAQPNAYADMYPRTDFAALHAFGDFLWQWRRRRPQSREQRHWQCRCKEIG